MVGKGQGGQGGSVLIFCEEIKGNGEINVDGGNGLIGGKGGNINIIAKKNNLTGKLNAKGGKSLKK